LAHAPLFRRNQPIDLLSAAEQQMLPDGRQSNLYGLAVQLTIDPAVRSFRFVASLPLGDEQVAVGMLVAERDEGLVAYDIVDERPHRDIDTEGLLLIALERHGITLVEIDADNIGAQPMAGHCEYIWKHRNLEVGQDVRLLIEQALEGRRLSVRDLGRAAKLRNAQATVCALICRRVLYTDLSSRFGLASWVARRADRMAGQSFARATSTGLEKMAAEGTKR
jgi:hypothetical protein